MMSVGRNVSDPKCADIKKTYQYRAVSKFVDRARECGLTRNQMQALVKEIIKYAKDHKLLYRGTAILNMSDMLSICIKRIEMNAEMADMVVETIKSSIGSINASEPLCESENFGGYPRLVSAVNSGIMPVELLALSKRCVAAIHRLRQSDRELLPSDGELLRMRVSLLMDASIRDKLKEALGDDLAEAGVPI